MTAVRTRGRDLARTGVRGHPTGGPDPLAAFLSRALAWVLTVGGAVGTAAAFALVLDRIALLEDPAFVPSCDISPLLSCGSVMSSPQAEAFGFPNPLIGLVAFPVVTTLGVVALTGAALPRRLLLGLQVGALGGVVFVHWLIGQSLYAIGTLCPYCMVVWVVTITVFVYTTLHNLVAGHLPVPAGWRRAVRRAAGFHSVLLTSWLLVVVALVAARFWPYWTGQV